MTVMQQVSALDEHIRTAHYEVVVIGAGFGGMYAIHKFRQLGRNVHCFEAGDGVGGTWYWNRYPGARVDIESMQYSYGFDNDLQQEWKWPEFFSPQADLEAYANHVADRFDLRKDIEFETRVNGLTFDEASKLWHVSTERGHHVTAKYIVAATGALDASNIPPFPGLENYKGRMYHTSRWPKDGVDFANQRVGLIGTGSTGIQVATTVAKTAGHLTVFQRTPAYSIPARNMPLDPAYEQDWKTHYPERRAIANTLPQLTYFNMSGDPGSALDYSPEEREARFEAAWNARSGLGFLGTFNDITTSLAANDLASEFVRKKIKQIVKAPETAELLSPTTYPIGGKRICMDTGYFDIFNQENVSLIDVKTHPIVEFTEAGLRTDKEEYPLDIIILATGFDAVTGALTRMNVKGVGGVNLADKWVDGPANFLGMFVAGFPNLFMVHGPGSPGVLAQMIAGGEWQVNWIAGFIEDMEKRGNKTVDVLPAFEESWAGEMEAAASHTLYVKAESWYNGSNIEGKKKGFMIYIGGFDRYAARIQEQVDKDYEGFVFDQ